MSGWKLGYDRGPKYTWKDQAKDELLARHATRKVKLRCGCEYDVMETHPHTKHPHLSTSAGVSSQEETVRIVKRLRDMRNTIDAKAATESSRDWADMSDELGEIIERLVKERDEDMGMVTDARADADQAEFVLSLVQSRLSQHFGPKVYSNTIEARDKKFVTELAGYINEALHRRPYWVEKKDWGSDTTPREPIQDEPTRSTCPGAPPAGRA